MSYTSFTFSYKLLCVSIQGGCWHFKDCKKNILHKSWMLNENKMLDLTSKTRKRRLYIIHPYTYSFCCKMMEMIKRGMPIEWEFLTHSFKNTSWTYDLLPKGDACKARDSLWLSCEVGMPKDGYMIALWSSLFSRKKDQCWKELTFYEGCRICSKMHGCHLIGVYT